MVAEFAFVIEAKNVVVEPFVVITSFKRQQQVVFLYELQLLPGDLGIPLKRSAEIMLWITVNAFVVQRIGAAEKVFPPLILEAIGSIGLGIITGAELGGGSATETQAEAFYRVKAVESAGRSYFKDAGLLVSSQEQGAPVHEPAEGFHVLKAVDIGVDLRFSRGEGVMAGIDPEAVGLSAGAVENDRWRPPEDAVADRLIGPEILEGDDTLTKKARACLVEPEIPEHIALRQQVPPILLSFKVLIDLHFPDEIEIDALADEQPQLLDRIVAVERYPHGAPEKQVIGIPGTERKPDELLTVDHYRIVNEIHIKGRAHIGDGAQE